MKEGGSSVVTIAPPGPVSCVVSWVSAVLLNRKTEKSDTKTDSVGRSACACVAQGLIFFLIEKLKRARQKQGPPHRAGGWRNNKEEGQVVGAGTRWEG